DTFAQHTSGGCLDVSVRHVHLVTSDAGLKDSPSARAAEARHEAWKNDIPLNDVRALWSWIDGLDESSRLALLAHCLSFGVNALYERINPYGAGISQHGLKQRLREADRLVEATGLDMVEAGWRPTVDNYLGRVTKSRIIEAVRDARGEAAAQLIDHLKKPEMAKEAERLLADSGWLPEPLRAIGDDQPVAESGDGEAEALPAFLAGDDDVAAAGHEALPVAAE
ncbi:MAG: DNA-binding protein, partial [Devosia sp.]